MPHPLIFTVLTPWLLIAGFLAFALGDLTTGAGTTAAGVLSFFVWLGSAAS